VSGDTTGEALRADSARAVPWGPAVAGVAGLALVVAGTALPSSPFTTKLAGAWFFGIPGPGSVPGDPWLSLLLVYGGIVVLVGAWLVLVRRAAGQTLRQLAVVAAVWVVPLLIAPPLLSRDAYSYGAEGQLVAAGLNPYSRTLAAHRASVFFHLADPLWRTAHAPYGPLFFDLARANALVMGDNVTATLAGFRIIALAGLVLMAVAVPALARACGQPAAPAFALTVLNPLILLYLIGGMHNDALMLGLLLAGVALAVRRHPVAGIVLCALAAQVKVPAALGIVFIGWTWAGPGAAVRQRVRTLAGALAIGASVMTLVTLASGFGWGWVTGLSTPGAVVSWLDPATAMGLALAGVCHALGLTVSTLTLVGAARAGALVVAALLVLYLLVHVDRLGLPRALGWSLLAVVLLGPIVWPWYESWGIAFLAVAADRWSRRWTVLLSVLACFATVPTGVTLSGAGLLLVLAGLSALAAVTLAIVARSSPRPPVMVKPPAMTGEARGAAQLPAPPAHCQPGHDEHSRHRHRRGTVDPAAARRLDRGRVLGRLLFCLARLVLRVTHPIACLAGRGPRLAAQVGGRLRGAVPGPRLHVGLGDERLDGLPELMPGPLDVGSEGLGGLGRRIAAGSLLAHRCALSLICSTSAFTLSAASVGIGGVAFLSAPRPANAAMPAAPSSATPTISAASHARITPASAMIAQAIRHPTPYSPMMPLPPNRPAPFPAVLALLVISVVASLISSRTSRDSCSESCLTSWLAEASFPPPVGWAVEAGPPGPSGPPRSVISFPFCRSLPSLP
jgi:alpha-1,6-mannosyltransferase